MSLTNVYRLILTTKSYINNTTTKIITTRSKSDSLLNRAIDYSDDISIGGSVDSWTTCVESWPTHSDLTVDSKWSSSSFSSSSKSFSSDESLSESVDEDFEESLDHLALDLNNKKRAPTNKRGTTFTDSQLSVGKACCGNPNPSCIDLAFIKKLRTDPNTGHYCPDKDDNLIKFGNCAFWHILHASTNEELVKKLVLRVLHGLSMQLSTEFCNTNWTVRTNILHMLVVHLETYPELMKEFLTHYMLTCSRYIADGAGEAEEENELLDRVGQTFDTADVLDWALCALNDHSGQEMVLANDMSSWENINMDVKGFFTSYRLILTNKHFNPTNIINISYPPQLDWDEAWELNRSQFAGVEYTKADPEIKAKIIAQVYSYCLMDPNDVQYIKSKKDFVERDDDVEVDDVVDFYLDEDSVEEDSDYDSDDDMIPIRY